MSKKIEHTEKLAQENMSEKEVEKPVAHHSLGLKAHKSVVIKHHHAKPFRKRHVAGFTLFLIVGAVMIGLLAGYNSTVREGIDSAKDFIAKSINPKKEVNTTVRSTYGFSITYDSGKFYATGIDTQTGDLYIGSELNVNRAYELLRIAPSLSDAEKENTNMTIRYYHKDTLADPNNIAAVEQLALKDITSKANLQIKKTGTSNVTYGGKQFVKSEWEFQSDNKVLAGFTPSFTTYTTVHDGKAFVAEVINSAVSVQKVNQYEEVLQSLYFGPTEKSALLPVTPATEQLAQKSRNFVESALFGKIASAAESGSSLTSENISAIYSPAVVKIFNIYCQDIYFDGELALSDACDGGTGSGFFISPDGYIASNGHVTNSDPLDILIQVAYEFYRRGNTKVLDRLVTEANVKASDLPEGGSVAERSEALFDLLYKIEPSRLESRNSAINLMVSLGKDQPDIKELIKLTDEKQAYPEQSTIKKAKVIAQDYRSIQGFTKFLTSDVSIIKIEGSNYPVTKLGSITTLLQGANLNILGYPGNASNNGVVDSGTNTVTLTSGKVSSIKNALGSEKKLIETDTTIGHGNSGGPAFNDAGEVVGISTYTATKVGDGTYNYIRDVKDLIDLAKDSSVTVSSESITQSEWEKAIKLFNEARYSKSLKSFEKVKQQYPSHPKVDEFVAAAEENIKQGKDVKDFPVLLVGGGATVLLVAAGVLAFMIHRHKKAHNVYKAHVGAGMMQPIPQGAAPQTVMYDPAHIAAQKNVVQMHQYMQQGVQSGHQSAPVQQQAPMQSGMPQQVMQPQAAMPQEQMPQQPVYTTMPTQTVHPAQNQQPPTPPAA